jgi:hypothetical protein
MGQRLREAMRLGWPKRRLACSFCGRRADAVERLVGGASAYICDTCIASCVAILHEHGGFAAPRVADRTNQV